MKPAIALVGRPNVGKSTLFNRLVGRKLALVDDQPGVTRDMREGEGRIGDLTFTVMDTAGLDDGRKDELASRMEAQSLKAANKADVIFFVIDARAGLTPLDKQLAANVRKLGKPVHLIANKAEGRAGESGLLEAFQLGLGDPIAISAEHGEGIGDLYDVIEAYVPESEEEEQEEEVEGEFDPDAVEEVRPLRLAIIGQPNAGKSTLVNALLQEERMLTGPEAGITRDAIFSDWRYGGRDIKLWDTAGIRRKSKVHGKIEKLSVADAIRAIRFADCVVILIDASMQIERQDLSLADLVAQEGRSVVLALSKWDLVEEKQKVLSEVHSKLEDVLPEIRGVPVVTISSKQERGIDKLMKAVFDAVDRWSARVPTGQVNRWLEIALEQNPPPAPSGRRIKIRYATQVSSRPPTFAIFGNQLSKLPDSYKRYLTNTMRRDFNLDGIPIRFSLRGGKNPFEGKRRR